MLESIFLGLFLVGLLFAVFSAIFSGAFHHEFGAGSSFEGGAHPGDMGGEVGPGPMEGQAEVGWSQHGLSTFSPLSPTVIASFVTAGGGAGYLALHSFGWSEWEASALASAAGVVVATAVFLIVAAIFKATQGSSEMVVSALVGTTAEVVTAIPSGGAGEIAYVQRGQRAASPARAADAAAIPRGSKVVIRSVSPMVFVVEETRESWLAREKSAPQGHRS